MAMSVLHFRSTIGMYGAESVVFNLLRQARGSGKHYSLACIEGTNFGAEQLAEKTMPFANNLYRYKTAKRLDFRAIYKIRKTLAQYDVVHTHDYKSLMYVSCAKLLMKKPRIFHHIHGALGNSRMERIYAAIENFLIKFVDGVITVSDAQRDELRHHYHNVPVIKQIDNGVFVPPAEPTPVADETLRIVMVARFTPEKNHTLALNVLSALIKQGTRAHLTLLGDGPLLEGMRSLAQESDLISAITFVGFTREVGIWLNKADVLLITSRTEGMPMAMLEAMAAGLAVVSTGVGQIPQIIRAAECGCLADSTEGLAGQLQVLAASPAYRAELGIRGRNYVLQHCSVEKQIADIHAFYEEAAAC